MVEGRTLHFGARGLYDGGLLLGDRETGSFWRHLTGTCVNGPLQGHQLEVSPLVHMRAGQALRGYPGAGIALSKLSFAQRGFVRAQEGVLRLLGGRLPPGFQWTMGTEDRRRPRMEVGLGVWSDRAQRFYPLSAVGENRRALIDEFDGQRTLVYIDPISDVPVCLRTDAADCSWQEDALLLDTGETIRGGVFHNAQGTVRAPRRPRQSITCWYGYAFTFPGGSIYGD